MILAEVEVQTEQEISTTIKGMCNSNSYKPTPLIQNCVLDFSDAEVQTDIVTKHDVATFTKGMLGTMCLQCMP